MPGSGIGTSTESARVSTPDLSSSQPLALRLPVEAPPARPAGRAMGLPMTYTAKVFNSAAEISREDWQAVCATAAAPVFMDLRFIAAIENALKSTCRFWFVIVYDERSQPVAAAGLTAMTVDFTDFGDPRVTWAIKYNPLLWRFRNMRMLFCSLPGSPGDRGIALVPDADSAKALAVLDDLMVKLATDARLDAVIFKELAPPDLGWMDPLLARGYLRVEVPAMHLLDPAFGSFAEYCAALRTRYRQQVNKSARKLKGANIVSTVITDPQEILRRYTPETHEMYCEMTRK
jgi:predicted N-acyltransferase